MILVDTTVWVEFFNRSSKSPYRRKLTSLIQEEKDIALVDISLTEILQGIRSEEDFEFIKAYLLDFPIFSARGINTYIEAAKLYRTCRQRGITPRTTIDCLIAQIAIENDLILFHKNQDFDLIAKCTDLKCLSI